MGSDLPLLDRYDLATRFALHETVRGAVRMASTRLEDPEVVDALLDLLDSVRAAVERAEQAQPTTLRRRRWWWR